jgi:hypothetical protein
LRVPSEPGLQVERAKRENRKANPSFSAEEYISNY